MAPTKILFLIAVLFCTNFCAAQHPNEQTRTHLKNFREAYVRSILERKPEMLLAYYSDDIRLMPEYQKTVMGKNHALSYQKAFTARFEVKAYTREELETLDLGNRVVELGMFKMKMKTKSNGKEMELEGKYQNIWQKAKNGKLSLITEAWNYSHPVEGAEHLRFEEVPAVNVALQSHVPIDNPVRFELAALNRLAEVTISQHDARIWSQFYADDALFVYSHHPIHRGRKELDAFFEKHVKELPIFEKLDIRNDRIDDLGNYVIEYASHIAIVRNGDYSGVSTGKNIMIWRREKNGSLKFSGELRCTIENGPF